MEDKPFALIGINTNGYKADKLREVMDKENLPWRSFADTDGGGGRGVSPTPGTSRARRRSSSSTIAA